MADGIKIGDAYVEVHLKDDTDKDWNVIKAKLTAIKPIEQKVKVDVDKAHIEREGVAASALLGRTFLRNVSKVMSPVAGLMTAALRPGLFLSLAGAAGVAAAAVGVFHAATADSFQALQLYQEGLIDDRKMDMFEKKFALLTDVQKNFTMFLIKEMMPALGKLQAISSENMLPGLEVGLRKALSLMPILEKQTASTAKIMGDFMVKIGQLFEQSSFQKNLDTWMSSLNGFAHTVGTVFIQLLDRIVQFGAEMKPVTEAVGMFAQMVGNGLVGMMNELAPHAESFARIWEALGRIFQVLLPLIGEFIGQLADFMAPILEAIAGWLEKNKQAISDLIPLIAGLALAAKGLSILVSVAKWVSAVYNSYKVLRDVLTGFPKAPVVGPAGGTAAGGTAAGGAAGGKHRSGTTGFGGGGKHAKPMSGGVLAGIGGAAVTAAVLVEGMLPSPEAAKGEVDRYFLDMSDNTAAAVRAMWDAAIALIFSGDAGPFAQIGREIATEWNEMWASFENGSAPIVQWWNATWAGFEGYFKGIWTGITTWWNETWLAIETAIKGAITGFQTFWNDTWLAVETFFKTTWTTITTFWNETWLTVETFIRAAITGFQTFWNETWLAVETFFNDLWTRLTTFWNTTWATVETAVRGLITGFQEFWNTTWTAIETFLNDLWTRLTTFWNETWAGAEATMRGAIEGFRAFWNEKWQAVEDFINTAATNINNAIQTIIDKVNEAIAAIAGLNAQGTVVGSGSDFGVPQNAHGGIIGAAAAGGVRRGLTLVGEHGPELVRLPTGSSVYGNAMSSRLMKQGGGRGGPVSTQVSFSGRTDSAMANAVMYLIRTGKIQITQNQIKR